MAASARYFDLVREMKNAYNHRLRLVESARQRGIKPTARLFATPLPTVRKWLRRYQQQGPSGLLEVSRAPHRQPRKTPAPLEQQLVALRNSLPTFGARRLIREFDLPISHRALDRIWRAHGLLKKRRRKYQRKQDLAHIKACWALFQQIRRIPRISTISRGTGYKPNDWASPPFNTPPEKSAAACSSWLSPSSARPRPARSLLHVFSSISTATEFRSAIWSGRPTMAASSRATSAKRSATASMCASHQPRTPTRATRKPCIASRKMSSSISKTSPAAATSSPKCTPTSCTSTLSAPTLTRKIRAPGRSSTGSSLARRSNSACFHPSSWTTT